MADQDTLPKKARKFFFDQNNFDDDFVEEVIEEEPPPPVFSEEELEAAKKDAFARGKNEGLAEAAASREKFVADLLKRITDNFSRLFNQEDARASLYEQESVQLNRAIFEKLFPAFNNKYGFDEIETVIRKVLESQTSHAEIILEVHPDYVEDIENCLQKAVNPLQNKTSCIVSGNDDLGPGDFQMRWKDGGAIRNAEMLSEQIAQQLELVLADQAPVRDNGEDDLPEAAGKLDGKKENDPRSAASPAPADIPGTEMNDE